VDVYVLKHDEGSLTVYNELVFVSTISGKFYAVSKQTGKTLWSLEEGMKLFHVFPGHFYPITV
jgi:outer membrane protein assembly factor BamB